MNVNVYPSPPETSRWVDKNRFISVLHTKQQQALMEALRSTYSNLSFAQKIETDPTALDESGLPCVALIAMAIAYQQMLTLNRVDVLSPQMADYFQAASALGVYGGTPGEISAEIERIKADLPPNA